MAEAISPGSFASSTSAVTEADKRFNRMQSEYQDGWQPSHQDLAKYFNQSRGRFDDVSNKGQMFDHKTVLDGYGAIASSILASGLLSGMTSPSRPWFKLELDDVLLNAEPGTREWLDETERRMLEVMNKSNIYQALHSAYEEIGIFGTACFIILEDPVDLIRARSFTAGEYYLGTDSRGRVNSFAREYWIMTGQLVKEFGKENVSSQVLSDFNQNKVDNWVKVRHLIEPNDTRIPGMSDFTGKEYRSVYWEVSRGNTKFLAKRGFDNFPVLAPRWSTVTTSNIYGYGPGWFGLGDNKQLQKTANDKLLAQEKLHNPPMQADSDIEGFIQLMPGGITKTSINTPDAGVRPSYQVPDALQSFIEMENHLKENIDRFFFVNLFLMLLNIDRTNMTATEVAERQQEKIMMMGPILHRLQEELLDPLIDLIFSIMVDNELIPEPPPSLEGMNLRVKYVSILAQAQQSLGVQQIQRVMETVTGVSQFRPDILDNFDFDQIAREVNNMEGAPAKIILEPDEVQDIREAKEQQQQMAQAAEVANTGSQAIRNLAQAQENLDESGT